MTPEILGLTPDRWEVIEAAIQIFAYCAGLLVAVKF